MILIIVHKVQGFGVWVVSGLWLCNWMTKQVAHPNFSFSDVVPPNSEAKLLGAE